MLIVGCGCRGQVLAEALVDAGYAVRGTTRDPARLADIEASRAQGVVADPDRMGTIMGQLAGVSVVCWLMGSVDGESAADLHGPRLETLLERLVDTPVRGLVYEGAGSVDAELLGGGARLVREAGRLWRMPVAVSAVEPAERGPWLAEMQAAVTELLSSEC